MVFKDLYSFLFHGKKALAKKPKPWRISFLLEVLYGGWSIIRDEIILCIPVKANSSHPLYQPRSLDLVKEK